MVNVWATLPDHRFAELRSRFGVVPGDWIQVKDYEVARELLRLVGAGGAAESVTDPRGALSARCVQHGISAGSSTLGMLSAMPGSLRRQAVYASATAVLDGGIGSFSSYFATEVLKTGASHLAFMVNGYCPVCFVVSGQCNSEKMLISYAGVSDQFAGCDVGILSPDLIVIDSYELLAGPLAEFLHILICARRYKIALSLGSHIILRGKLLERARCYLERRLIYILCGNTREYQAVFPELGGALTDSQFRDHRIGRLVPYALVTDGPRGMAAYWGGTYVHRVADVLNPDEIVNTAGAGDTAAGVLCASILQGLDPADALTLACDRARQVLTVGASRLECEG
jgi:hypothetical protein